MYDIGGSPADGSPEDVEDEVTNEDNKTDETESGNNQDESSKGNGTPSFETIAMLFVFAVFIGAFARGFIIFMLMKSGWPVAEKFVDWQKVEEFADTNADTK